MDEQTEHKSVCICIGKYLGLVESSGKIQVTLDLNEGCQPKHDVMVKHKLLHPVELLWELKYAVPPGYDGSDGKAGGKAFVNMFCSSRNDIYWGQECQTPQE